MATITNKGRVPRGFHIASKGQFVELPRDASAEVSADDLARLRGGSFDALVADGVIVVTGEADHDHDDHGDDAPEKPRRGRKPKAKPDDAAPQSVPDAGSASE